jgi:hypothetical protein
MPERHPFFDAEIDRDAPVWRYFDLPRFLSLLEKNALYFCRADLLGDPLEGSLTKANEAERDLWLRNPPSGVTREEVEAVMRHNSAIGEGFKRQVYVNCWHLGAHESMAMWRGYGSGPFGIAIRTEFGILDDVLPTTSPCVPPRPLYLSRVQYLDHSSAAVRIPHENNMFGPFLCKSLAYSHENELRAIFLDVLADTNRGGPAGHLIELGLSRLVKRVVVSPLAPPWFESLVRNTCLKFGLALDVTNSSVVVPPIY